MQEGGESELEGMFNFVLNLIDLLTVKGISKMRAYLPFVSLLSI